MVDASFTYEELAGLDASDLRKLLEYLKLPYDKRSKKGSLLVLLNDYFESLRPKPATPFYDEKPPETVSVRVARIYGENK